MSLSEAKKNRKIERAHLTKHTNTLSTELDREDITAVELQSLLDEFVRKANKLEDAERNLEFFIEESEIEESE